MGKMTKSEEESFHFLKPNEEFIVVGISASPYRLEALAQFFNQMIPASGLAFIVAPHGAGSQALFPLDVIANYTMMEVYQVEDSTVIRPNSVYLLPPNK